MEKRNQEITRQRLLELVSFCPETGVFTRKIGRGNQTKAGEVIGTPDGNGYLRTYLDGGRYLLHRLAWLYVYGYWPAFDIDHCNGVRSDNRLCNLREATRSENQQNRAIGRNNTSGHIGVYWHKHDKRWVAQIRIGKKRIHVGQFESIEEAVAARAKAKAEIHKFQPYDRNSTVNTVARIR